MKKLLGALALTAMLAGCAVPQSGHDFNMACADNLQKGVTTKEEVFACLGQPTHTSLDKSGRALYQWIYIKAGIVNRPSAKAEGL